MVYRDKVKGGNVCVALMNLFNVWLLIGPCVHSQTLRKGCPLSKIEVPHKETSVVSRNESTESCHNSQRSVTCDSNMEDLSEFRSGDYVYHLTLIVDQTSPLPDLQWEVESTEVPDLHCEIEST